MRSDGVDISWLGTLSLTPDESELEMVAAVLNISVNQLTDLTSLDDNDETETGKYMTGS